MPAKKKGPPAPATNGEPASALAGKEPKPRRMTKAQRERRIQALQDHVARLKAMAEARSGVAGVVPTQAEAPEVKGRR